MQSETPKTLRTRGFTMVELMVVIVIIAVLALLAFVGGQRILNKGREAAAIGNMRQVANGVFAIQADGGVLKNYKLRGGYPGESGRQKPGGNLFPWWTEVAINMGYGYHKEDSWSTDFVWTIDPNETAFHDPTADWEISDDQDISPHTTDTFWDTAHFGYNIRLGAFINPFASSFVKGQGGYQSDAQNLVSQTKYPSDLIYLAQSAGAGGRSQKEAQIKQDIDFQFNTTGSQLLTPWSGGDGTPAVRVRGGANAVMADGSVRWINTKKLYEGNWNSPHFEPDSTGPRKDIYD
ncbi:MAG: type II secretion system protein [Verrucomicrobiota bacterium]